MSATALQLLQSYQSMVVAFSDFFTVAVHMVLFQRAIYPKDSFLRMRKYDFPVWQSRHPEVCRWISAAVAAVEAQLLKGTVARTSLLITSKDQALLERYVFSTEAFPAVHAFNAMTRLRAELQHESDLRGDDGNEGVTGRAPHDKSAKAKESDESSIEGELNLQEEDRTSRQSTPSPEQEIRDCIKMALPMVELTSQFAAYLSNLVHVTNGLGPLPKGSTFTLAIEPRDAKVKSLPIESLNGKWIPSTPRSLDVAGHEGRVPGQSHETFAGDELPQSQVIERSSRFLAERTIPLRSVVADPFHMEAWMQQASAAAVSVAPPVLRRQESVQLEYEDL